MDLQAAQAEGSLEVARAPAWLPLLVVAAAWLAQGGVLGSDWILDDAGLVRDNPYLEGKVGDVGRAFQPGAWVAEAEPGAWRPLALATLALEAPLWRGDHGRLTPFGFHVTNLVLHAVAGVLLLVLARRLAGRRWWLAAGLAVLFVVHPVHVPTLARVAGRADVLALVFALLTALMWRKALRDGGGWVPLVALGYLLALLAKETAIGLPLALLALDFGSPSAAAPRRRWAVFAALLVVLGLYLGISPALRPSLATGFSLGLEGLSRMAASVFLPVGLVRDAAEVRGGAPILLLAGGGALVAIAGTLLALRRRGIVASGFVSFVAMGLLGALVAPEGASLEARAAYVVAPGLFAVLALLLVAVAAPGAPGARRWVGLVAAAGAVLCLGGLARAESVAWQDEVEWHRALIRRHPDREALTLRLLHRLRAEAVALRAEAAAMPSGGEERMITLRRFRGLVSEAAAGGRELLEKDPGSAVGWRELGLAELLAGLVPEASRSLEWSLAIEEEQPEVHRALGRALLAQGRRDEAAHHGAEALKLDPEGLETLKEAGLLLTRTGRHYEGLKALRRAIDLARSPSESMELDRLFQQARRAARDLADVAMREGAREEEQRRYRTAVEAYQRALQADPSRLAAYLRLAWIRGEYFGEYRSAHEILDRALRVLKMVGGADAKALGRVETQRKALFEQQMRDEAEERGD